MFSPSCLVAEGSDRGIFCGCLASSQCQPTASCLNQSFLTFTLLNLSLISPGQWAPVCDSVVYCDKNTTRSRSRTLDHPSWSQKLRSSCQRHSPSKFTPNELLLKWKKVKQVSKASKEKGFRWVTPPCSSHLVFWKLFQMFFPLARPDIQNVAHEFIHHNDRISLFLRNLQTYAFMDSQKGHQETSEHLYIG